MFPTEIINRAAAKADAAQRRLESASRASRMPGDDFGAEQARRARELNRAKRQEMLWLDLVDDCTESLRDERPCAPMEEGVGVPGRLNSLNTTPESPRKAVLSATTLG